MNAGRVAVIPGRTMPSAKRIARFWAGRCLKYDAPLIHARVSHCSDWTSTCCDLDESRFTHTYCDGGEPDCLSCGQFLGEAADGGRWFYGVRAHIVPHCLGGRDAVWNIVPLCERCHDINPEQESRRVYLDWLIYRCRYVEKVKRQFVNQTAAEHPMLDVMHTYDQAETQAILDVMMSRIREVIYAR